MVGDDDGYLSEALTKCSADIFDTGFQKMIEPCKGTYVVIRRNFK